MYFVIEMDIANGIACESLVCQEMNRSAPTQPLRQSRSDVLLTAVLRGGTIEAEESIKGEISGKQTD